MTALTDFLLARIAEDEAAYDGPDTSMFGDMSMFGVWTSDDAYAVGVGAGRWRAECEAKRRIVALADETLAAEVRQGDASALGADLMLFEVLRLLTLPYADHPDYDPAWRSR